MAFRSVCGVEVSPGILYNRGSPKSKSRYFPPQEDLYIAKLSGSIQSAMAEAGQQATNNYLQIWEPGKKLPASSANVHTSVANGNSRLLMAASSYCEIRLYVSSMVISVHSSVAKQKRAYLS